MRDWIETLIDLNVIVLLNAAATMRSCIYRHTVFPPYPLMQNKLGLEKYPNTSRSTFYLL